MEVDMEVEREVEVKVEVVHLTWQGSPDTTPNFFRSLGPGLRPFRKQTSVSPLMLRALPHVHASHLGSVWQSWRHRPQLVALRVAYKAFGQ
mmetsp:Transcript_29848/g.63517  ORF Transcript_29848/g.63517 Transcript_29848/m.63517 type:complete len:91 (-) Transcript_29848:332-604(-)